MNLLSIPVILAFAGGTSAAADAPQSADRPRVVFAKHKEIGCEWTMREQGSGQVRGSISRGEQSPVLHIVDPLFGDWSEIDDPKLDLSSDRSRRRTEAMGYVIHAKTGATLGIFLDEKLRPVVGRALQLDLWKDGKLVLRQPLANMPSAAALAACVSEGD